MKLAKNLPQLKELLKAEGLSERAVLVSKCGMQDEEIYYDLSLPGSEKVSYFSTMIVKKGGVR